MKTAVVHRDTKPSNDEHAGERDPRPDNEVLDIDEAAALLRISRDTLYAEVAANRIPHRRLGKLIRFSRTALVRWLDGPTHKET
jgi:excisionase family DNA binding protein